MSPVSQLDLLVIRVEGKKLKRESCGDGRDWWMAGGLPSRPCSPQCLVGSGKGSAYSRANIHILQVLSLQYRRVT
ncbi:hypothetical protein E2C01_017623 [Portunus trituberculatus]|uniref:Uncharacterized protein n=1 Tax=Portunus trituberculatus TaxID=210409 RepID=A0A5B7DU05_PORTR|nr:hypothetical protein [Portunus trituberculatus]